jgi:hypothetical protein
MSGGALEKYTGGNLEVDVYSYKTPDGDLSLIDAETYDHMMSKEKSGKEERAKCPPSGEPEKTQLLRRHGKPDMCVTPQVESRIAAIMRKKHREDNRLVDEYLSTNDITELVSPYMNDPVQTTILSHILGTKSVKEMQKLNALVYSGIIKNSCPPPGAEHKTEAYVNFLTGKTECREPIPSRPQVTLKDGKPWGVDKCPDPLGDPLAVEKYITFFGEGKCRRPVVSGEFSCPPADDPNKIHHITLPNNVGICVEDSRAKDPKQRVVMPVQLVYPPEINDEIIGFIKLASRANFTRDTLSLLGEQLRKTSNVSGLQNVLAGLSGSPHFELAQVIIGNIRSPNQIPLAQTALWELQKMTASEKGQLNAQNFLHHYGLTPDSFRQVGGRRERMLREHQK